METEINPPEESDEEFMSSYAKRAKKAYEEGLTSVEGQKNPHSMFGIKGVFWLRGYTTARYRERLVERLRQRNKND